jgi:hypothetical protein
VQRLVENPLLLRQMGKRAYMNIDQYSWDHVILTLVSLWEGTLGNYPSAGESFFYKACKNL